MQMVPSAETLVLRPHRPNWGPVLAAVLSTNAVGQYVRGAAAATGPPTLTVNLLQELPVPALDSEEAQVVAHLVTEADTLAQEGERVLDLVRQEVDLVLEGTPSEPPTGSTCWLEPYRIPLRGWAWGNACLGRLQAQVRSRCKTARLRSLADLLGGEPSRQPTAEVANAVVIIDKGFVRPDWFLAVPPPGPLPSSPASAAGWGQGPLMQKLQEEALLVPLVGDVTAPPVVIGNDLLAWAGGTVQVGLRWLPVTRFRYTRALGVVLDHPFVGLQRQLAGTGSTVTHLAQEDVAAVLVPDVVEEVWARWEARLVEAHTTLFRAAAVANQAIATAEGWYA
jgi:hypothetical protein